MSIVVGVAPGRETRPAVRLGALLARSYGQPLVLVTVHSRGWPLGQPSGDAEYQGFLAGRSRAALEEALAHLPDGTAARTTVHEASSTRRGLLEVCEEAGAVRLVLGSAPDAAPGRIALGSVATGLLQSSAVPVALAPRDWDVPDTLDLRRVTVGYSGSATSTELVGGAARVARDSGADLRVASFAVRHRWERVPWAGARGESAVVEAWEQDVRARARHVLDSLGEELRRATKAETAVGSGIGWEATVLDVGWEEAEVLLLGSSGLGPLHQVSLGSHAAKILRSSPVPVVVVPRRATEAYVSPPPG